MFENQDPIPGLKLELTNAARTANVSARKLSRLLKILGEKKILTEEELEGISRIVG